MFLACEYFRVHDLFDHCQELGVHRDDLIHLHHIQALIKQALLFFHYLILIPTWIPTIILLIHSSLLLLHVLLLMLLDLNKVLFDDLREKRVIIYLLLWLLLRLFLLWLRLRSDRFLHLLKHSRVLLGVLLQVINHQSARPGKLVELLLEILHLKFL